MKNSLFVLVAGGVKDYKGIKIRLQTELLTLRVFIELYIEHAYEDRIRKNIYPQIDIFHFTLWHQE